MVVKGESYIPPGSGLNNLLFNLRDEIGRFVPEEERLFWFSIGERDSDTHKNPVTEHGEMNISYFHRTFTNSADFVTVGDFSVMYDNIVIVPYDLEKYMEKVGWVHRFLL